MSGIDESSRPGLLLTASGPDRPGMVSDLAAFVGEFGGNIEDTRMAKLGGEFAVLVLITGSLAALEQLSASKNALEEKLNVSCSFKNTNRAAASGDGLFYQLEVSGFDRPGIVKTVSALLSSRGINVASLSSKVVHAPHTGTPVFVLNADLSVPSKTNIGELRRALTATCEPENLDYSLDLGRG